MDSSQLQDCWLGRSIGERQRYRLDKRLGSSGMAEVFLAMDTLLSQPVALKLLNEKLAVGEMRRRFEREIALCAALRSDHIVRVSDHGVTPEGYPFFVMEYLHGQTLRQLLNREKRLSIERTVNIVTQICEGLHLAHQGVTLWYPGATSSESVKIVHRDLKPDNVFLLQTALGELVKILDFGIAKIRSSQEENSNATRMFLGTYRYAAPEQFEVGKDLDGRADIYSLGVILYEMLSGSDPFGFSSSMTQVSGGTWAVAHLNQPVLRLGEQPGCEHLPPELESLVMRCLQKDPKQRFASVSELDIALRAATSLSERPLETAHSLKAISATDTAFSTAVHSSWQLPTSRVTAIVEASPLSASQAEMSSHSLRRQPVLLWVGAICTVLLGVGLGLRYSARFSGLSAHPRIVQEPVAAPPNIAVNSQGKSLVGHSDTVWAVAVTPNGQTLISGSFDRTVRLWNLQTGELRHLLTGHTDAVRAVAVSADGQTVASGSSDKTIKIWQSTGKLLHTLTGHMGPIWSVAISPNGQTLASGSYDGTIKLWNLQTGKLLRTLPDHYDSVWSVTISPDGQTLASGSYDGTIKLWNLQTGKLLRTLSGHGEAVRSVVISPNGQTLASASWDKTVKIWNLQTGELLHTLTGHSDRVVAVALAPSGQAIVSASLDHTLKIWNLQTGQLLETLSGHRDWVVSAAFSPDGSKIASGSKDRTVKIWTVGTGSNLLKAAGSED